MSPGKNGITRGTLPLGGGGGGGGGFYGGFAEGGNGGSEMCDAESGTDGVCIIQYYHY